MARDFASMEGLKSGGILYVFPAFQTAPAEQKIRHPPAGDLFRGSLVVATNTLDLLGQFYPNKSGVFFYEML